MNAARRQLKVFNIDVIDVISIKDLKFLANKNYGPLAGGRIVISVCNNSLDGKNRLLCIADKLLRRLSSHTKLTEIRKRAIKLEFPYWRERREEITLYTQEHKDELDKLAGLLADDLSRECLFEIIRCSVENDIYRNKEGHQIDKYWECYTHKPDEVWCNCGSATGDTILKYLDKGFSYKKIYAFEGDRDEFQRLKRTIGKLNDSRIELHNEYIGMKYDDDNFDHRFCNAPVTLINMDIEGSEMGVLNGAKTIIKKYRPVLAICAYHKASDLIDIPSLIKETVSDYSIYLRKYRGYEPNTLNEYLYYAVPKERCLA